MLIPFSALKNPQVLPSLFSVSSPGVQRQQTEEDQQAATIRNSAFKTWQIQKLLTKKRYAEFRVQIKQPQTSALDFARVYKR